MKVVSTLQEWRELRSALSVDLGFVPTLGALHEGHASLLRRSVDESEQTILSIYLNPTQFNNSTDLANYPSTLREDLCWANELGVDIVLTPTYEQLYPDNFRYQVNESEFSRELCGADREGHFTGVLTVVMKLLNLVRPKRAYFGEKDYQQFLLVRDMCEAFFIDVDIVACKTVREPDGLALSSRNALLDSPGRERAAMMNRVIGKSCSDTAAAAALERAGFAVDYVSTLNGRRFAAATLRCQERKVRLIDNVPLQVEQA
ncbi:MAG: pantoate--beta-alanine ligase [Gammaproteobacteria bacterium]|nr:pantoate--beta-alanine ligase [Gammaproteobacteria bacterium]